MEILTGDFQEFNGQSISLGHDENFDCLLSVDKLFMSFQKLNNMIVIEQDWRLCIKLIKSLVMHHYRDEVDQFDRCLLLGIYLGVLDGH